jgi:hypothetical protein
MAITLRRGMAITLRRGMAITLRSSAIASGCRSR